MAASASAAAPADTTLRLLATSGAGTIDPQLNYTAQYWQIFAPVYDGLVAFRKVGGVAGTAVVADLAEAVPEPEDGRIYRFRLRPGLQFSTGAPVRGADVVASFRRIFTVGSPTAETYYGGIVGAAACLAGPCTGLDALPGVRAEGDDITITLLQPDPEFLQKLALPHASILPADAPLHDAGTVAIAGTGPWRIVSYDPGDALVLERNPHFKEWSAEAQPAALPNGLRYQFGLEPETEVTAVLNGQADWMFDTPPSDRLGELAARLHINPAAAIGFVPLNTRIPPFDDLRARQAFAMAVDRAAVVRLAGGSALYAPQCRITPPSLRPAGADASCATPYDPARARALLAQSGLAGQSVTLVVDDSPGARAIGTYLVQVLGDIGFRARLQSLSASVQFSFIQNTANRVQASLTSWYADYPSAASIIAGNFGCAAFRPGSDSSTNIAGFCDRALDLRLAAGETEAVDQAIGAQVPAIVLDTPRYVDLVSARVGGFVYHETFRWLMQRAVLRPAGP